MVQHPYGEVKGWVGLFLGETKLEVFVEATSRSSFHVASKGSDLWPALPGSLGQARNFVFDEWKPARKSLRDLFE